MKKILKAITFNQLSKLKNNDNLFTKDTISLDDNKNRKYLDNLEYQKYLKNLSNESSDYNDQ
ncbi:MAG: hypothetical protein ACLR9X_04590 [Clostridia bacterium]